MLRPGSTVDRVSTATTTSAATGYAAGTREYRRVVTALFAAGLATFALLYSTQALLPELSAQFGVSVGRSALTLSLTTAALGLALLVVGPVSDVVGRTRLLHASLGASAVVAVACALAPSWSSLLALRTLQGLALAGLPAVATAYLREELHPSTHARAAGLYIGGTALGGMVGRLLTGAVGEVGGWRWALAATALVAVACAVVVRVLLPPSRGFDPRPVGVRHLVDGTLRALRDPVLVGLFVVGGLAAGSLVAVFNGLGFRLAGAPFHLGLGVASLVFLVYPLGSAGSVVSGRVADVRGRRAVLPVGAVLALAGVLLTGPDSLFTVVAGTAVLTVGFFVVHGVASGWVPARAAAVGASTAQAASLYLFAFYLGSSMLGAAAGPALSAAGWSGLVALAAGLFGVTAVLAVLLRRTRPLVETATR